MYTPPLLSIQSTNGKNLGGIRYFDFCPREWLSIEIFIDPITRVVATPLSFIAGRGMLRCECLTETMGFTEKPKDSKSGGYYEQKLIGVINKDELHKSINLDTCRFHELVSIYYDKNNQAKVIGSKKSGMNIISSLEIEPATAGKSFYQIELNFQSEHPSPFYQP